MSTPKNELYIITSTKKFTEYINQINENAPKKFRHTFISRIDNMCVDIIELLYLANSYKVGDERRKENQRLIKVKFS